MSARCRAKVKAATKGALGDDDIDNLVERLWDRYQAAQRGEPLADPKAAMASAAEGVKTDELRKALIEKRMRIFNRRAKERRETAMGAMGGDPAQRLLTFIEGDEQQGAGRAFSVDAMGRAMEADLLAGVERELRKGGLWDRIGNWLGGQDADFERAVAVEMARRNGGKDAPTGNADAEAVAEVLGAAIDRGRKLQNDNGAWIGKLDGYIVRQQHDSVKVAGGFWSGVGQLKPGALKNGAVADAPAFQRWRAAIEPLLAESTFKDVKDRGEFLRAAWWNIVTGRHSVMTGLTDMGEFRPPPSKARAVSESRVLHFKDADAWLTYHRQFGRGSLYSAVAGDLRRAARNAALMRGFGTVPEAAFQAEVERGLKAARNAGDAAAGKSQNGEAVRRAFDTLNGAADAPENIKLAMIGQMIRGHESVSKLGGMVLSAFADVPVATQALARAGVDWLEGYQAVMGGVARLGGAEAKEVADLLDVGARAASGRLSTRFAAKDGPVGWVSWGQHMNLKISGFEWWNDGLRSGVATMLARDLGRQADTAYAGLKAGTRETLERFGIDAAGWDKLRAGARDIGDGRYLALDAAGDDGDLSLRFRALVQETIDNATSEARGRERRQLAGGTQRGTIAGEAIRLYTQFWSFPQTFIGRSLMPAARGYAGQKPAALIAHLVLSTTLFGFVSMQAKQIVKGREPRPVTPEAFMASMLQGGGLGIYGDFLFGEFNRFGGSPIETLGGPAVGDAGQMLKLFAKLRSGEDPAAEAFQFAKSNTPFVNTWWTRAALDYTLFWRVQEALNPGWAGRHERNVERATGSAFWLRPTEAVN